MDTRLAERVYEAIGNAVRLQGATETIAQLQSLRDAVANTRRASAGDAALDVGDFRIQGTLEDGTRAEAYRINGRLHCDEALRRRAELLVAMEERFAAEGVDTALEASLNGNPLAIALTLTRAMRVQSFEMRLSADVRVEKRFGSVTLSR